MGEGFGQSGMVFCCVVVPTHIQVNQTGGNRFDLTGYRLNRSGPVSVWADTKPAQIQNSNLNLKNKKFLKILQGATNLMVSNFLKIRPFSIVCGHMKLNQKRKRKKWAGPLRPTSKPSEFLVETPVTGQTGPVNRSVSRPEPVEHAILNLTGFNQ